MFLIHFLVDSGEAAFVLPWSLDFFPEYFSHPDESHSHNPKGTSGRFRSNGREIYSTPSKKPHSLRPFLLRKFVLFVRKSWAHFFPLFGPPRGLRITKTTVTQRTRNALVSLLVPDFHHHRAIFTSPKSSSCQFWSSSSSEIQRFAKSHFGDWLWNTAIISSVSRTHELWAKN